MSHYYRIRVETNVFLDKWNPNGFPAAIRVGEVAEDTLSNMASFSHFVLKPAVPVRRFDGGAAHSRKNDDPHRSKCGSVEKQTSGEKEEPVRG
mmetsp:Transcript_39445/g.118434  ORF Transcript_39445/g.118434 Transcript_39445/m.118434 type:complete len:93 (+) Transcript_39445:538-816(+)